MSGGGAGSKPRSTVISICSLIYLRFRDYVPMKKRTVLIASLVPLIMPLLGVMTFVWMNKREPTYDGHALSYWLETPLSQESRTALLAIGTNAIPHLLYWMTNRPPPWKLKVAQTLGPWIPASMISRLCQSRQSKAMIGFMMLGTNAASAIPVLEQFQQNPICDRYAGTALE
jgi:hypothetical protein